MECRSEHRNKRGFELAWRGLAEVQFERFSGCMRCWAPQAVCHSWEEVQTGGRARWKRRGEQECQFKGVLRDAMAGILTESYEGVIKRWVESEQSKVGFQANREEDEWEVLKRWMGQRVVYGGIEMSEMCRMFWTWGHSW